MELTERKKRILTAVVEGYIETAEPVGSKAVAPQLGFSSATIRNEMAELTAMGYLEQPHTSAGRIPSAAGYRLYVNELMAGKKLSDEETESIRRQLSDREKQIDVLMEEVGHLTSSLTHYPAYAMAVKEPAVIRRFDFIYVDTNTFIIVAMLSDNVVKNKLVHMPFSVEQSMIGRLNALFNADFTNLRDEQITESLIRNTERAARDNYGLVSVAAAFAIEILEASASGTVSVDGASHLLAQPEYSDPQKAHALMSFISDGDRLLSDLPGLDSDGLRVTIGPENLAEELKDSSVIMASYDAGGGMRGYIGVVGPTRMDYSGVAARLSCIAAGLSQMLAGSDLSRGVNNKLVLKEREHHE